MPIIFLQFLIFILFILVSEIKISPLLGLIIPEIRSIKVSDDIERVKRYAEDVARQNHQQSIFIAGCLTRIAELQTLVVRNIDKQPKESKNLLKKILKLE